MSEIAYDAFGNVGLYIVSFFFNSLALGAPILYLVLAARNSQSIFSNIGIEYWTYIWGTVLFIPFALLKTMKEAALIR